jgi:hypothetical protein
MMRHELRLCLRQLGELALERIGDTAMQLLAPPPQQARVRCILQQGVLEDIRGIRRLAAAEDQSSARELLQSRLQRIAGNRRHGREQAIRELTTDGSTDLGNLLDGAEPIKTRHQ